MLAGFALVANLTEGGATKFPSEQIGEREGEDGEDGHEAVGHEFFAFGEAHAEEDEEEDEDPAVVLEGKDVEGEEAEDGAEGDRGDEGGFAFGFDEAHDSAHDHQHDVNPKHGVRVHGRRIHEARTLSKQRKAISVRSSKTRLRDPHKRGCLAVFFPNEEIQ
jgi:hypothetical protein